MMPPGGNRHTDNVSRADADSVETAQRLAKRAMSLARSRADASAAAAVLRGWARGNTVALTLAIARCRAAVDQNPGDTAARQAAALLEALLEAGIGPSQTPKADP